MKNNREKLSFLELQKDPIFHLIPESKYLYYIRESIKLGEEASQVYINTDIRKLYKQHNINISFNNNKTIAKNFQLRAEYIKKDNKNQVVIHTVPLKKMIETWNTSSYVDTSLSLQKLIDIHLAHEFHHYLEYNVTNPVEKKLDTVQTTTFFGRKKDRHIVQCSEIASHTFAQQITGFEYFPTIIDLIYLKKKNKLNEEFENFLKGEKNEE